MNMKKSSDTLLDLIVWTGVTRSILVVSPVNTVKIVTTMRCLVSHNLTPMKVPWARRLPTTLITSLVLLAFIALNFQIMLVVNHQDDGYKAIEMCKNFYDVVPYDPYDGGRG